MPFASITTDTIDLLKADGTKFEKIKAVVDVGKIIIMSPGKMVIDVNDLVQRPLSNGAIETYRVNNPQFFEKFHAIPPHYELHVTKLGIPEAKAAIQNITNNITITGDNAHVNQHSLDQSTNVVQTALEYSTHISHLRSAVAGSNLTPSEKADASDTIDAVEEQFKSGKPKRSVVNTLLKALPHVPAAANAIAALIGLLGHL